MRNIFVQPNKGGLPNLKGVYIEDQKTFNKDEPEIIKRLAVETSQGNFDTTYLDWKAYLVDLGGGDIGLCIVDETEQA